MTVALDLRRECLHVTKNKTHRILKYGNCTFRTTVTVCGIRWSIRKVATGDVLHDAGQSGVMSLWSLSIGSISVFCCLAMLVPGHLVVQSSEVAMCVCGGFSLMMPHVTCCALT